MAKKHLKFCPCCEGKEGEGGKSLEHLLIDCQKWRESPERAVYYGGRSEYDIACGSRVEGGENDTTEYNGRRVAHWLPRSIDSETIKCGAFQVARFLNCTRSERVTVLHHKDLGIGTSD